MSAEAIYMKMCISNYLENLEDEELLSLILGLLRY